MTNHFSRRDFLRAAATGTAMALPISAVAVPPKAARSALPWWRGFNLVNFFQAQSRGEEGQGMVREDDLKWIRDWGFDFVRLPMDYWLWIDSDWATMRKMRPDDVFKIKESMLEKVDLAVDLCRKQGLHLNLNFHRVPGYCINNPEREPFVLWSDKKAEDAFVYHWQIFAKRDQAVPAKELSFNLVNELAESP